VPKPPETAPAVDWKKQWKWIGAAASGILAAWFIIGNFVPPAIGAVVKAVLSIIVGVFQ
jgi:hypothetical protein